MENLQILQVVQFMEELVKGLKSGTYKGGQILL